ncbi:hypothetical protein [Sphingomonas sp. BK580]|uniref:hypothetical protein n=1 Tax=Sphingomonas sp. BK580 TaxID=2586972 RepID=UPI00160D2513|nr:hypothetical protein [Sphingomonas sp. BK580]MBB3695034.1 hypothetical protein [Sphingomonas sp. BK580]
MVGELRCYEIFADYFQFYLWDGRYHPDDLGVFTDEECARHVKVAPHALVIMPVRNMTVPVVLDLRDAAPADPNLTEWDHVVDVSLTLPSGELELEAWQEEPIDRISVAPGSYRVRVCLGGLDTLSEDGLEGDDHYRLTLWPAPEAPLTAWKQYVPSPGRP